ncbi:carbon-nitrogen hydrolase family protein [Streptomyces sp. SBT349]|uniref:carbon-nitrogen hydrolase family protein n=1 Tax=Streptomyces sp. SBT349 TaxID=1580539 RepID=UPI00099B290F|nr:carbon-nitrogen hydrolase family protein [Streptomyces sp. SBT349]
MQETLVIAVAQPVCRACDVGANARAHAEVVRAAGARVVVFPELSLTGYELGAAVVAAGDARLAPLVAACAETGATALVGAPVEGDHIAVLAVEGGGATVAYRKMWLGAAEAERFAPGAEPAVWEVDGWRLGLGVCKDTGVVRHADDTAALGIDAYVAGIVHGADEVRVHGERARRIAAAHGVWVALASFAGPTGAGYDETAGHSGVWSPGGALIAGTGAEPGAFACATLDRAALAGTVPPASPGPLTRRGGARRAARG